VSRDKYNVPGIAYARWCGRTAGQSCLLPDARVQANLHQYLSTHVIPAQAGIQEGERKNFWIPACAGMTFWNREKSRNSGIPGISYLSPTPPFKKRSLWSNLQEDISTLDKEDIIILVQHQDLVRA